MNRVILIGRLGADPEVKFINVNGQQKAVCNLRLATNERIASGDGTMATHTEWHSISVFDRTAENAGQYLKKGREVSVEGRLRTRSYEDKAGIRRFSTEVRADRIEYLGRGEQAQAQVTEPVAPTLPEDGAVEAEIPA